MKYEAAFFCSSCDHRLSWNVKMDSHGVCPYCGAVSGSTVVDCYTKSVPVEEIDGPDFADWSAFISIAMVLITGFVLFAIAI